MRLNCMRQLKHQTTPEADAKIVWSYGRTYSTKYGMEKLTRRNPSMQITFVWPVEILGKYFLALLRLSKCNQPKENAKILVDWISASNQCRRRARKYCKHLMGNGRISSGNILKFPYFSSEISSRLSSMMQTIKFRNNAWEVRKQAKLKNNYWHLRYSHNGQLVKQAKQFAGKFTWR